MKRRTFLKGAVAYSTIGLAVGAGLLTPRSVLAAWPADAFKSYPNPSHPDPRATDPVPEVLKSLYGADYVEKDGSGKVNLKVKTEGEINPASLPVKVSTELPAESIAIIARINPVPLISSYDLTPSVEATISTKIKLAATSDVIAVVKVTEGGKTVLYRVHQNVTVTGGGCAA
jgi:sulfur-oxidizing protein SoxY